MREDHPNLAVLADINITDIAGSAHLFTEDVVWHFVNPEAPDLAGAYVGRHGLKGFFDKLAVRTGGTFKVKVIEARAVGDEFAVAHTCNSMTLDGETFEVDVVLVWRFRDGRIAEVWDIPAVNSRRPAN
ncbi:MAG: nuclear transport factor 2 family protein [Pseudomonadota bacterium]